MRRCTEELPSVFSLLPHCPGTDEDAVDARAFEAAPNDKTEEELNVKA